MTLDSQTFKQSLIEYSEKIVNGDILACKKHQWSCLRFLNDLKKERTDGFPYYFDADEGLRACNWIRLFKHKEGILAGKKIEPDMLVQFILGNVYGWKQVKNGYRRFDKMYWQVGRKNMKSQLLSAIALYETFVIGGSEDKKQVYCAATKKDQAKIVFNAALDMLHGSEELRGKWKFSYGVITHLKSGSFLKAMSTDDNKGGDGFNPQCGIIDEYHLHTTTEAYDIIGSGMGARPQPLLAVITTAGFNMNAPCYTIEYELVSKILNPHIDVSVENYFAMVNELDSKDEWKDEEMWIKANPVVCSYEEGRDKLRKDFAEAKLDATKLVTFLTKRMNVWLNESSSGYISAESWQSCKSENFPDIKGKACYIGVDLSKRDDLTSWGIIIPEDGLFICKSQSYMPEKVQHQKEKRDKVPYMSWSQSGYITLVPGDIVDNEFFVDSLDKFVKDNQLIVKMLGIDPWGASYVSHLWIERGYNVIEVPQNYRTLSLPTKDFKAAVANKTVIHDGNPVLGWAVSNAMVSCDSNENEKLDKKKSTQRIDPIAALINAFVFANVDKFANSGLNVYFG